MRAIFKKFSNNNKALPAFILICGLIIALLLSSIFRNVEQSKIKEGIIADAEAHSILIRQKIDSNINVLRSLKAFYDASTFIDRQGFKTFVTPLIENHKDIQSLEWIPRVPNAKLGALKALATEQGLNDFSIQEKNMSGIIQKTQEIRDYYYPVFYIEPMAENTKHIGYNIGANSDRLETMMKSAEMGREIASAPVTVTDKETYDEAHKVILIFSPIYQKSTVKNQTGLDNISGFVVMVLKIDDVISNAITNAYQDLYTNNVYIKDITEADYITPVINTPLESTTSDVIKYTDFINVAGRIWEVHINQDTDTVYSQQTSSTPVIIFWATLLLTLLVLITILQLINRRTGIQKIVKTQTKELKAAKDKIEETLNFQDLVLETIPDFVFVKDNEFKIIQANQAFINLYPKNKHDKIIGYTTLEEYPKHEVGKFLEQDKIAFETGFSEVEERITFPDGKVRTVLTKKTRFKGLDGKTYILGTSRDISDFLETTENLKNMGQIIEDSLNEVFIFDAKSYNFLQVNQGALKNIGYSLDALLMMTPIDIKPDYTLEDFEILIRPLIDGTEEKMTFETVHQRKDKSLYDVEIHLQKSLFQGNEAYVAIIMDITARKKFEEELMRSNIELERFAYVAAHDMQEPLRMVVNFAELLERFHLEELTGDAKEFLHHCIEGANQMKRLVDDLLEYSRTGEGEETLEPVDLNAAIDMALGNLQETITRKNALINISDMPVIKGSEIRMMRLFQNFIGNALKYQKPDTQPIIDIGVKDKKAEWIFWIKDNGIGIKKEYQKQIFEPFKRLHRRAVYPGTGIGLSICAKILDSMNGQIWIESEENKGTTFFFSIPKET